MASNLSLVYKAIFAFLVGLLIAKKFLSINESTTLDNRSWTEHDQSLQSKRRQEMLSVLLEQEDDLDHVVSRDDELDELTTDQQRARSPLLLKMLKEEQNAVAKYNVMHTSEVNVVGTQAKENKWASLSLKYKVPSKTETYGQVFDVNAGLLSSMDLPPSKFTQLNEDTITNFVFAVPVNDMTFTRSEATVASIQQYFPKYKVVVMDLGLSDTMVQEVKTWCNVIFRKFAFSRYPPHVQDYRTYAWRPLAVQDILRFFPAVFWVESPFSADTAMLGDILHRTMASGGLFTLKPSGHSIYAATHPDMYDLLPAEQDKLKAIRMWSFTAALIFNSEELYTGVLYWWYLCALDPLCVSPANITVPCPLIDHNPNIDQFSTYFNCHRHDQSSLNVLAAIHYDYRVSRYTMYQPEQFIKLDQNYNRQFSEQATVCSS